MVLRLTYSILYLEYIPVEIHAKNMKPNNNITPLELIRSEKLEEFINDCKEVLSQNIAKNRLR